MLEIMKKLNDATARVERVIFLAGALATSGTCTRDLDDYLDDQADEDIEKCFGKIPDWVYIDGCGMDRAESVFEWLRDSGKLGFLVQFATPIMEPVSKDCRSFSWGYYNTQWIYGDTIEAAVEKGLAWVETRRAAEDAKADEEKGGAQ